MAPWKYRPTDPDPERVEWEDNAISNTLAWCSDTIFPHFCKTPEHWTSRFANYFWTDCPCCLFLRGVVVGIAVSAVSLYAFESILNFSYNLLKGL